MLMDKYLICSFSIFGCASGVISDLIDKLRDAKVTFGVGTTTYRSRTVTNGKQPSSPIKDSSNPP